MMALRISRLRALGMTPAQAALVAALLWGANDG